MRNWHRTLTLGLMLATPTLAQEVPFAQRPSSAASGPRLSDLMTNILQRHAIIWFAGSQKNWALADYEVTQVKDRLVEAASLYQNIPVETIISMTKPLDALAETIKQRDDAKFSRTFTETTAACNACHRAAQVGFIMVKHPTASPYSNLTLTPAR